MPASVKHRSAEGLKANLREADLKALNKRIERVVAEKKDQLRSVRSDLKKLAASKKTRMAASVSDSWSDPDDAPELTEEYFERADLYRGDKLVRRGRPPSANPKKATKLRLDADVVEHFRATGPGWQTRINDTLRRVAKLGPRS
jgi:uncharacterized protein (DUF4415 family)